MARKYESKKKSDGATKKSSLINDLDWLFNDKDWLARGIQLKFSSSLSSETSSETRATYQKMSQNIKKRSVIPNLVSFWYLFGSLESLLARLRPPEYEN